MKKPLNQKELWDLPPLEFNKWRKENDFPRIVDFLNKELPRFNQWKDKYNISDVDLTNFGPARFLRDYDIGGIYRIKTPEDGIIEDVLPFDIPDGSNIPMLHDVMIFGKTESKRIFSPYLNWIKTQTEGKRTLERFSTLYVSKRGSNCYLWGKCLLLKLGGYTVDSSVDLSQRLLEFTDLENLNLVEPHYCYGYLNIWFCTAHGISIKGSLNSLDFYMTAIGTPFLKELKLSDGIYNGWRFSDVSINGTYKNSTLTNWKLGKNSAFSPLLINCEIKDIEPTFHKISPLSGFNLCRLLRKQFSEQGDRHSASSYYYLERKFELKRLLNPFKFDKDLKHLDITANEIEVGDQCSLWGRLRKFISTQIDLYTKLKTWKSYVKYRLQLLHLSIEYAVWGFGERPMRSVGLSFLLILFFSSFLYFHPESNSYKNTINSFVTSVSSFSLGQSSLVGESYLIKTLIGIEKLLGIFCIGIFIAGFANKSRY